MTETNLQETFVNHGIVKFGEIGDEFDPAIHEAMFQIPDPDATPDTIGQLLSCGYKFKDRVLTDKLTQVWWFYLYKKCYNILMCA